MTAFLKIDHCVGCQQGKPWEWIPAILLNGKILAGTGVWRSPLTEGRCSPCLALKRDQEKIGQRAIALRNGVLELFGGITPYREFTFERFRVRPGNQLAFTRAKTFLPKSDNLFLWGSCGVGKTHLAYAAVRQALEQGLNAAIITVSQLVRRSRMKEPEQEQAAIDHWAGVGVLVIEELGKGSDTSYSRQLLQEILDRRTFQDRGGLIVTSQFSLDAIARKSDDDAIPSRLAGMCMVTEIRGDDERLSQRRIFNGEV